MDNVVWGNGLVLAGVGGGVGSAVGTTIAVLDAPAVAVAIAVAAIAAGGYRAYQVLCCENNGGKTNKVSESSNSRIISNYNR